MKCWGAWTTGFLGAGGKTGGWKKAGERDGSGAIRLVIGERGEGKTKYFCWWWISLGRRAVGGGFAECLKTSSNWEASEKRGRSVSFERLSFGLESKQRKRKDWHRKKKEGKNPQGFYLTGVEGQKVGGQISRPWLSNTLTGERGPR